ncbi:hypothetical protein BOSEA31B_14979 [Hyphomicrobiales bacterium]|nr:hypothetical protein BOSEA31B_14979 [Hyphomicrobiales bacterium]CAH1701465.1 hypothetical protein BOSEA1005_21164 [Hyphomicrobiales bacterium]CAI0345422.1 hypothetical protein BO1005MUT1_390094 [Hyphomicrobiales bacterium]
MVEAGEALNSLCVQLPAGNDLLGPKGRPRASHFMSRANLRLAAWQSRSKIRLQRGVAMSSRMPGRAGTCRGADDFAQC